MNKNKDDCGESGFDNANCSLEEENGQRQQNSVNESNSGTNYFPESPPPYSSNAPMTAPIVVNVNLTPEAEGPTKVLLHSASKYVRSLFLRFVYAIMAGQCLVIIGMLCGFLFIPNLKSVFDDMSGFKFWPIWIVLFILMSVFKICDGIMRKPPMDLVLVAMVTIFTGLLLGSLSAYLNTDRILIGVGIVGIICFLIVIYTFQPNDQITGQPKFPFTPIRSIGFVFLLLAVAFGILCCFYSVLDSLKIDLAPISFCTYMIVAHHIELKDERRALMSNEFIYAAVSIFMFVFGLFANFLCFCVICLCHKGTRGHEISIINIRGF